MKSLLEAEFNDELKRRLMLLIGDSIDEKAIDGLESFVEMDDSVIHLCAHDKEKYFQVILTEITKDE